MKLQKSLWESEHWFSCGTSTPPMFTSVKGSCLTRPHTVVRECKVTKQKGDRDYPKTCNISLSLY